MLFPLYVRPVDTGPGDPDATPIEISVVYAFIKFGIGISNE